ncbi:SDR family oxidoreductase [Streptomyces sp. SID13726]|uniref:SDR family oxidoreductase n=1 Tax=Streptomyces sp. SID13726 TaxID=2706058 RepID=UPI0013BC3BFF|nr:SDR family oxidoreductase [Streptomyces sp. SID13726]NEA99202.1 SDR family oxidoreductase [Streptomyces sp. SID13726]
MTADHTGAAPLAVVTGANRGIGLEVVRQLADRGHRVLLGSRDLDKGRAAAAQVDPGGTRVTAVRLDVSDAASVDALAALVTREFGRTDVVVNNAAILYDTWAQARTADLDEVRQALDTNLFGAWRVTQALLPLLVRSPSPRVVNVSSGAGSLESMDGGTPAYSVSKAALNALTRLLAGELRPHRVLVNAVCPGWVATDMGGAGGRPVAEGAAGVVWAATLPDDGPSGGFFRDREPVAW